MVIIEWILVCLLLWKILKNRIGWIIKIIAILLLQLLPGTQVYEVFSVYTIKSETYYLTTSFKDDKNYIEFLNTLKRRSIYNFGVNLNSEDSILTLSTCDATGKSRVIVHAKKIV